MHQETERSRWSARRRIAVVVMAIGLVAAACGDDDDDTGAAADNETASAETTTTDAGDDTGASSDDMDESSDDAAGSNDGDGGAEGKVTDYVAYVGGPGGAADPSLDPIKIGYINQDGGAIVVSSTHDDGVDIAVEYLNSQAGGIGGHPIEIVPCLIANSEEEGQQCGQDFANDDEIVAVISGPTVTGTQSFYAALDGAKAVVHGVSVSPVDIVQPNVAVLNGGAAYILAPMGTFAQDVLGAESAALVYSEETQSDAAAGQAAAFEALGIPIEVVSFPSSAPDLTVPLLAAGAPDADVVMPVITTAECVKFAEAQRQLGIPDENVLASPVCLSPSTIEGLGAFPNWNYGITTSLGSDADDPSVPPYQEILAAQGQEDFVPDPWVLVGFAETLTLAQWLNNLGPDDITTEGILAEMADFTGPLVLGAPVLDCGKYPEAPAMCGDNTQFYTFTGEGFEQASDFLPPPEGWELPS
ncbi:MAG: ABC transporter substrate-binding protein [Actinomycetota bacterium]|nr:ABC transporter substrate-binding protein [Actinomycetota bacterium]